VENTVNFRQLPILPPESQCAPKDHLARLGSPSQSVMSSDVSPLRQNEKITTKRVKWFAQSTVEHAVAEGLIIQKAWMRTVHAPPREVEGLAVDGRNPLG
jgi:hypothetical protein